MLLLVASIGLISISALWLPVSLVTDCQMKISIYLSLCFRNYTDYYGYIKNENLPLTKFTKVDASISVVIIAAPQEQILSIFDELFRCVRMSTYDDPVNSTFNSNILKKMSAIHIYWPRLIVTPRFGLI